MVIREPLAVLLGVVMLLVIGVVVWALVGGIFRPRSTPRNENGGPPGPRS
jgi:ABC-type transporter Mla subunit MlaD